MADKLELEKELSIEEYKQLKDVEFDHVFKLIEKFTLLTKINQIKNVKYSSYGFPVVSIINVSNSNDFQIVLRNPDFSLMRVKFVHSDIEYLLSVFLTYCYIENLINTIK